MSAAAMAARREAQEVPLQVAPEGSPKPLTVKVAPEAAEADVARTETQIVATRPRMQS